MHFDTVSCATVILRVVGKIFKRFFTNISELIFRKECKSKRAWVAVPKISTGTSLGRLGAYEA